LPNQITAMKKWKCIKSWGVSFKKGKIYTQKGESILNEGGGAFPVVPYSKRAPQEFSLCFKPINFIVYYEQITATINR